MNAVVDAGLRTLAIEASAIQAAKASINAEFEQVVEAILQAQGRLVLGGIGKSGHIARKIAATFASTGTPSFFLHAAEAGHGDLGMVTANDLLFLLSYSGETDEVVRVFMFATDLRLPKIVVTSGAESPLARLADLPIIYDNLDEGCPVGRAPMASCLQQMAVGDIIAADLMQRRDFTEADFLRFHHGGYLGRDIAALEMMRAKG